MSYNQEITQLEIAWLSNCAHSDKKQPNPMTKEKMLCTHMQMHNDNTIKTSDTVLSKIYLSHYLEGLCVRGSWRPNRTATY